MSAGLAIIFAFLSSAGAAVCAFADGALLAIDADSPPADLRIAELIRRRDRTHRALAFARVALQLAAGAACAAAVREARGLETIPFLALVLGGILVVVLSETTAREAGDRAGVAGLVSTRAFVEITERGLAAVVMLGEWVDRSLATMLPANPPEQRDDDANVERFRSVVSSEAGGGPRQSALLTGVFALGDRTVADVMTPRTDVVGIEHAAGWDAVVGRVRSSEHSRIVVYGGSLDEVVGFLYAKDLLPFIASGAPPAAGWTSLVRPPTFIPASKRVDAQLRDFRAHHRHIAIVADEFGGTSGLVTIEDLLELIVGEIRDQYDVEEPEIQEQEGARFWVAGRLTLEQLSDYLGDDLRRDDVSTVGGLAHELFGRVPKAGEFVDYRSWRLIVERVRGRRVERVFLERHGVAVGAEDGA